MNKVNINTADINELLSLKYVGKKTAEKIISNRPYKDIYELSGVSGLGTIKMSFLLDFITI